MDKADTADDGRLWSEIHGLAPDVDVGVIKSLQDLRDGDPISNQLVLINRDLEGLAFPGPAADVHHTRYGLEAPCKNPTLHRLQTHYQAPPPSTNPIPYALS